MKKSLIMVPFVVALTLTPAVNALDTTTLVEAELKHHVPPDVEDIVALIKTIPQHTAARRAARLRSVELERGRAGEHVKFE